MSHRKVIERPADDGSFDELILEEAASCHFEMLDDNVLWVGIKAGDKHYVMTISARGRLKVQFGPE